MLNYSLRLKLIGKKTVKDPWHQNEHTNIQRIYYMDVDLYRYTIGRAGQSVQSDMMKKRYIIKKNRKMEDIFRKFHMEK